MGAIEEAVESEALGTGFSGVVRVDHAGAVPIVAAYGMAHRGWEIPNTVDTRFALASGTKGFTAVAIASLIQDGALALSTTARSVLGEDLPLIGDEVTIEHLLSHRSGIGDYLDEESGYDLGDYLMPVPVHQLAATQDYLAVLGGHPAKFPPGRRFAYSNGGFVVLALIAERASRIAFHELVRERVCVPAGMGDTAFLRSDELPGGAALGYLEIDGARRTNVFHLPVRGSGDGGIYSKLADIRAFWIAFLAGRIVSPHWVSELVRARSVVQAESRRYGLGFWLHESSDIVMLEGCDTGVSFRSAHAPHRDVTYSVISNTSAGAWPIAEVLEQRLF